jgi:cytochrome P450
VSVSGESFGFLSQVLTPEFHDDPYPLYHLLRETSPLCQTPFGVWLASRYVDVSVVLRDARLSTDARRSVLQFEAPGLAKSEITDGFMLFRDPPDHTRLRGLVAKAFTPRMLERLRPFVQARVDGLIEAAAGRDEPIDIMTDVAFRLPIAVMCELLGMPESQHVALQRCSRDLAHGMDPQFLRVTGQDQRIERAAADMIACFTELIARRRTAPGSDLLSELVAAHDADNRLSQQELVSTGILLLVAGHETTVNLIGNAVLALLRNPDQRCEVRNDPALDHSLVDELIRYDSPIQMTRRVALDERRIGTATIPAGHTVVALFGAANRDPEMFAEPDRLDVTRPNSHRHLGFGAGPHFCLGAALARMQGEILLPALVRTFPSMELAGEPVRHQNLNFRGLARLPVALGHPAHRV